MISFYFQAPLGEILIPSSNRASEVTKTTSHCAHSSSCSP